MDKERLDEIELSLERYEWMPDDIKAAIRDLLAAVRGGEPVAEALEQAAKLVSPHGNRPCDCEVCDCGKRDDAQRVAEWDQANRNAAAIRELAATAPPSAAPPALTDEEIKDQWAKSAAQSGTWREQVLPLARAIIRGGAK